MDAIWFFFVLVNCVLVSRGDGNISDTNATQLVENAEESKPFQLELFPSAPLKAGQTRMPRKFFSKVHSGVAFLTGLKLGTILSKKGFELGHGKIASTHSFQIFGKSVNSAMSLSYGNDASLLPLLDDEGSGSPKRTPVKKEEKNTYHVTVIENPSPESIQSLKIDDGKKEKEEENDKVDDSESDKRAEDVVVLYQDIEDSNGETEFLKEHNKRVKEFNESIVRRANSKF